ncbi:MFS transporter [Clostridium butyricum]|uniref:Transporter, major facilitator family n=1 Tax=Clostridium butyricum E4 str. BoNT E BL5262 TaxID=632245 RepID=C4ICZ8_CLOBU|nr:MFS transporter [Clostridium butyricum]EDT75570.1 transporter, major facilitator family [Clostridium butyricum 5521]EEP55940.1 transporter, major facilitator family [Clostridium butyricum E4 str. BoNT E BL5262]NFL31329.1 MFS transporter [Clostridium butyricum]NFS18350.1 MFS transporter [Clostridium butyricum]
MKIIKDKRKIYFSILYLMFVGDFISRVGINSIFPILQKQLNITDSQLGILSGVVLLGMASFVLIISYLGEKTSKRNVIAISALIWGVGSLFSGFASGFILLVLSRFFVGIGNSAYAPLATSTLTGLYDKSKWGKVIGLFNTAMTVGGAIGGILFVKIASTFGWRAGFYFIGVVSIVLSGLSLIIPDNRVKDNKNNNKNNVVSVKNAFKLIISNKALIIMCIGAGTAIMALTAINSWMSIYLVREMNLSITTVANLISIMALLSVVGFPIGGILLDILCKKSKKSCVLFPAVCITLTGIFYFIGFYFKSIPVILFAATLYTFGGTAFHTATQELVPTQLRSISYGTYVVFVQFLGALGPIFTGAISQAFGIGIAILIVQAFFILSAIILVISSIFYIKCFEEARAEDIVEVA